jgi:hypothetical protein
MRVTTEHAAKPFEKLPALFPPSYFKLYKQTVVQRQANIKITPLLSRFYIKLRFKSYA